MSEKESVSKPSASESTSDARLESGRDMTRSYIVGFAMSVVLTMVAYVIVSDDVSGRHVAFSHGVLTGIILVLALAQLLTQLSFFFHIDQERKPRLNATILGFAAIVVFILVAGSLWIMSNLNRNMTPDQMNTYMQSQDGL